MHWFRHVKKDLISERLNYKQDNNFGFVLSDVDKKHYICFEEISVLSLNVIPNKDKKFVTRHLDMLDYNYMNYIAYWNERYYRHLLCDSMELVDRHSEFQNNLKCIK